MSLTINQAALDLLSKLGIEVYGDAPALALQDVATAMNGAMQMLQDAGEDYFTRDTLTLSISAGTSYYRLPANIQSVIGPVLLDGSVPLRALESQGELDQFDRIYLGGTGYGANAGDPMAYFPRYIYNGATAGDIVGVEMLFCPVPAGTHTVQMDVVLDAPSYTVADLTATTVIPVAQNYTESIFLPIARMLVMRSSQFSRPELLPQLTSDAQVAMQRLGIAGGFPDVVQDNPPRKTKG
jgi:hypothetical protein